MALLTGCSSSVTYHAGDVEHGYASWYGAEEDGCPTADGECFHMNQLTAAHRHLPFGSLVRVTNEKNGRSVVVRINDRGPWTGHHRIIDVSAAAADELDMKEAGLVPVDVEVLSVGHRRPHATM